MRLRSSLPRFILIATVCAFIVGLAACTGSAETGPRAWIDFPRDGSTIPTGTFVTIVSHGFAEEGVADLQLSVNGEEYRRVSPEEPGATFCEVRQEWLPEEAGLYTLQVRTYDTAGAVSSPHGITLRVVDEIAAEPTGIPPATVTAVPSPTEPTTSTATPDETPTASATPTPIPPVATFTPTPVQPTPTFTALPPTPTLTPVPPTPTFTPIPPTPTLTPSPTIPPPGTSPPPAPIPMVPADGLALSCRTSQTLAWLPVEDPSGITGYYIRLERQVITNQWDLVREWGPVPDKQTVVEDLQCAVFYRWAVRAMDGAGNLSDWSEWSHFSLLLD